MEGMVDYQRLRDLQFEEICWNWSCCGFTWQSRRVSEIASRTERGGCLRYSVLDAGLSFGRRGLVYTRLGYWIVDTDLVKGLQQALPVCCSLVNNKEIESTFLCKAPRPSARVLTLRHAPTSRQ